MLSSEASSPCQRGLFGYKAKRMKKDSKVTTTARRKVTQSNEDSAPAASGKCVICGADAAPFSDEKLCWVCRRLKVSAWADSPEAQMFASE